MAKIVGAEGLTAAQVQAEVAQGAKFVIYLYCVSVLVMTFKRGSDIHYIRPGQNAVVKGLPFTFLTLFLGWWGLPWGLIRTPECLYTNLSGGKDVTQQVMGSLARSAASAGGTATTPGYNVPLDNPW